MKVEVPQKYTERRLELLEKYLKPTKFFIFSLLFVGILIFLDVPSKTTKWYNDVSYTHNVRKYERQYNKWLAEKQNLNEEYQEEQENYQSCANGDVILFECTKDIETGVIKGADLEKLQDKVEQKANEIKKLEDNEPVKPQKIQ